MRIPPLVKNNLLVLMIITVFYFLYASIFLKPWKLTNFSLVDDGQVLIQSSSYLEDCVLRLKCSKFIDQTFEFGTSRFRPTYWLINNIVYEVFRNNAQLHHIFRVYVVGYAAVILLSLALLDLSVSSVFVIGGALLFATNYSLSENIIRLGTNEPYQILFLAAFSLIYLHTLVRRDRRTKIPWVPIFILTITVLIKESNIAILPTIFITEILVFGKKAFKRASLLAGIPFIILLAGITITRFLSSTISTEIPLYTSNYVTSLGAIIAKSKENLVLLSNSLSPFFKISLILLVLLMLNKTARVEFKVGRVYFWGFFALFFTVILFPWEFVLERYQLVAVFGIIIFTMFLFDQAVKIFRKYFFQVKNEKMRVFFNAALIVIVLGLFLRGFPLNLAKTVNYQSRFLLVTQFEREQVRLIAKYNGEKIFVNAKENINNWEWLYEVPIHLKFFYGIEPNLEILKETIPSKGYIFSQVTFDKKYSGDELKKVGYEVLESKKYLVLWIDPLEFRSRFFSQPISTIINPPVSDYQEYYWEIGKVD